MQSCDKKTLGAHLENKRIAKVFPSAKDSVVIIL